MNTKQLYGAAEFFDFECSVVGCTMSGMTCSCTLFVFACSVLFQLGTSTSDHPETRKDMPRKLPRIVEDVPQQFLQAIGRGKEGGKDHLNMLRPGEIKS